MNKMNMDQEHLALFTSHLRDGGIQRVLLNLAEEFVKEGFEVDLVLLRAGTRNYNVPKGVRVVDIGAPRIYASISGLIRYLRSEQASTLLSAGTAVNITVLLAHYFSRSPARLVISEHSVTSINIEKSQDWRKKLLPKVMRKTYSSADDVIAVSEGVAKDVQQVTSVSEEKVHVIYNPIVTSEIHSKAEKTLSHSWFSSEERPIILAAGRFTPAKDFSTLIRAFSKISTDREARLVILGEGRKREELESLVQELNLADDVALPGFVDNPYKYMKRADVFVLSSKWEGFGNVLVEAMACGCPVVSTDCPSGPAEILEDGKWGRLVPIESPEALSRAITRTLDKPINGRERASDFSVDRAVEAYLKVLRGQK
jgi:glycosyltransferase involved in cell wall biosynthesis